MKKLFIVFDDDSKITYTMKDFVDHMDYFNRHKHLGIKSAILQQYPKKDNQPIDLLKGVVNDEN